MSEPVIINPSVTPAQVKTAVRYAVTFMAALVGQNALDKLVSPAHQDLLLSDTFAVVGSVAVGIGMWAWGAYETHRHKKQIVAAAQAAPDTKFIVQEPGK